MLNLQQFLSTNTPDDLKAQFDIDFKRHPKYPNLVQFAYGIESPKDHPIALECRGIILDQNDNWKVVAFPFTRFANYGESWAATINWNTVRVQSKLDGSLCILFNYSGEWLMATRGSPDAGGSVGDFNFTFNELFWRTFRGQGLSVETLNPNLCYVWELTSLYNRVVVRYPNERLTLIGLRDMNTLQEIPVRDVVGLPVVKEFPLNSLEAVIEASQVLDPLEEEGYVIVDGNFNRNKIKSPKYVIIHRLVGGLSRRNLLKLVMMGETSEVLTYFPEWKEEFDRVSVLFDNLVAQVESEYQALRDIPEQKTFALAAVQTKCSGALFALRKGTFASVKEFLTKISIEKVESLLGNDYILCDSPKVNLVIMPNVGIVELHDVE